MKCSFLILILTLQLVCSGCSSTKPDLSLLITSDSTPGIRAYQDQSPAQGKIVLKNVGDKQLTHLNLLIRTAPVGVSLTQGNCTQSLAPGQRCYYIVLYQPNFTSHNKVSNELATFIASATTSNGAISQDSYTLLLQRVPHDSWIKTGAMSSIGPQQNVNSLIKVQRGNKPIFYATGRNFLLDFSNNYNNSSVFRSTDGKHWSVVGDQAWNYTGSLFQGSDGKLYAAATNGVIQYDTSQCKWLLVGHWDNNYGMPAIVAQNSKGILYAATVNNTMIQFSDGKWTLVPRKAVDKNWNAIYALLATGKNVYNYLEINGILYVGDTDGVIKYDGDNKWTSIDADGWNSWIDPSSSGDSLGAAFVLFQDTTGDLYAGTKNGVIRYDNKNKQWVSSTTGLSSLAFPFESYYGSVISLADVQGNLYAGTSSGIIKKEKDNWVPADASWNYAPALALAVGADGDLYTWWQLQSPDNLMMYLGVAKFDDHDWSSAWIGAWMGGPRDPTITNRNVLNYEKARFPTLKVKSASYRINESIYADAGGVEKIGLTDWFSLSSESWNKNKFHSANDIIEISGIPYVAWGYGGAVRNGDILPVFILSSMTYIDGGVAKYDGKQWVSISSANNGWPDNVAALSLEQLNGTLYVALTANSYNGVMKYEGKRWVPVGASTWSYGTANALVQRKGVLYAASNAGVFQYYP